MCVWVCLLEHSYTYMGHNPSHHIIFHFWSTLFVSLTSYQHRTIVIIQRLNKYDKFKTILLMCVCLGCRGYDVLIMSTCFQTFIRVRWEVLLWGFWSISILLNSNSPWIFTSFEFVSDHFHSLSSIIISFSFGFHLLSNFFSSASSTSLFEVEHIYFEC